MRKYLSIAICIGVLAIAAGALLLWEADFLWKAQERNLFLDTPMFFREQMVVPGGLLSWAATFLTQFFYYPWLGTLLLCACWLLMMWLIRKAFALTDVWMPLTLVPVGLLLLTIVDMGYWVYMLKLPGHLFVGTLGTIAVSALLWAFRVIPCRYGLQLAFIVVTAVLAYPLFGIYGTAATVLTALYTWRLNPQPLWQKITGSVLALAGAAIVPQLCYSYVYYQTNLANIYYAALPLYVVAEEHHAYYLPFYALAAFFLLMTLLRLDSIRGIKAVIPQVLVMAGLTWAVASYWFKDENFHRELAMQRCIEQSDWQGVIDEALRQDDEPTRAIVMMRNLALSRLGRQASEMYLYKNGSKAYAAPFPMRLMLCVGPQMYYHYGMINYSARLSTEMGVEFGWRAENLKMLAKCAFVNKEAKRERKFLGILKHTAFYDDWGNVIHQQEEQKMVARMMHYTNFLTGDNGLVERFLMNRLAESTYTGDPFFQEQALLASLWTKDIRQFWFHYDNYVRLHPNAPLPRYIQEAAYFYDYLEDEPTGRQLPVDQSIKQSFERFMQASVPYNNTTPEYGREGLKAYSDTYFYDYYLMRDLEEY